MDRIFNINKPKGMTSHDVVYKVRKILGMKKVGHTGTLDPDAEGVLPICVGRATKVSDLILNKDKAYSCEMTIGIETDTYDSSGEVVYKKDISHITEEEVLEAIKSQMGLINQLPPKYSALKVNGKRMCDLVRSGRESEIKIKPRQIEIKKIEVKNIDFPTISFEVLCSKGTYVRSICHDIGEILGVGAHMSDLKRIQSGIFKIDKAITLEELENYKSKGLLCENSYSIEEVLGEFPYIILKNNAVKYYTNGGIIQSYRFEEYTFTDSDVQARVYSNEGFIGIGKIIRKEKEISVKSEKLFKLE
ncbi:tRNA pseudouridine(55) synthase TruB [Peptostreptococcus faecalis]|uniref:tRNA pseudouridine(55) synthase TruB n=1 Tax=Peptostreptococcus faecalis TaxID=2045015 RepID=UPI000C7E555B|nr:tRNA pseudouridine(55) synthase TruB [Peptostreptococcus faecalis]